MFKGRYLTCTHSLYCGCMLRGNVAGTEIAAQVQLVMSWRAMARDVNSFPVLWLHVSFFKNLIKSGSYTAFLNSRLKEQIGLQAELSDEVEARLCNTVKQTSLLLPLRYFLIRYDFPRWQI